jgi:hypothetical protein
MQAKQVTLTYKTTRVIALAGLQIHYLAQKLSSANETLDGVPTTICRQTEIFYAIMASTIPCLRPFLASFFTGFGAMGHDTVIAGSQVGNSREKSSYALGSMQSAESAARREKRKSSSRGLRSGLRRDSRGLDNFGNDAQNQACVSSHDTAGNLSGRTANAGGGGGGADAASITSNESTKMIIKKEVQWHVDSERGSMVRPL